MAITIEGLQIEITENSEKAVDGLDALTKSLEKLKRVTGDLGKSLEGVNFDTFNKQMKQLSTSLRPLQGFKTQASGLLNSLRHFKRTAEEINEFTGFDRFASQIKTLANSLTPLSGFNTKLGATLNALHELPVISDTLDTVDFESFGNNIKQLTNSLTPLTTIQTGLGSTLNQLSRFEQVVQQLDVVFQDTKAADNILKLVEALRPLTTLGKSTLGSMLNQLRKLPEIMEQLSKVDMDALGAQIERVVNAVKPLAEEMNKVAAGFSAFPTKIQRIISQNNKLESSNKRLGASYNSLGISISKVKFQIIALYFGLRRVARSMGEWVEESNDYVENLNLFRVTMRGASDEALEFANKVHDAFGIDPSEWIRFQAVFHNMATGFGIAADKATIMSKNLTQLGYDLATVFNVNYEVAMQKLQSALAGQPRPMREWGFDMSEATLKLAALRHGIEANVETMTQYEKSQIRYLQLMETAKRQGILGNFAREIHTPANAMRILNQQLQLFKRELGNMIIPLLMKVLPYLQAFVRVLTDAARALAAMFGFELPKIDYSGLGELPPLLDETEDGFESATGAAKKLKNILMGFDEINILPKDTGAGGIGSGGGIGGGGGFEIDPSIYDYDFLGDAQNKVNELVDRIYEKLQPVINFVRDNFDYVLLVAKTIGLTLLTWKIAKGVLDFFSNLGLLQKQGALRIALGVTLAVAGVTLITENIKAIMKGKWGNTSLTSLLLSTVGGGLVGLGAKALGVGWWAIPIGVVLTITVTSIATNWEEIRQMGVGYWDMIAGLFTVDEDRLFTGMKNYFLGFFEADLWTTKIAKWLYGDLWDDLYDITKDSETLSELWSNWWGRIAEHFDMGIVHIKAVIATTWADLKPHWEKLTVNIKDKVVEFKAKIATRWSDLKQKWDALTVNIKDKVVEFKARVATKWEDIRARWEELTINIKDKVANFKARVATKWVDIKARWEELTINIKDKVADFKGRVATRWADIRTDWNNLLINIQGKVVDFKGRVATKWSDLRTDWNNLVSNFKDRTIDFKVKLSTTVGSVRNFVNTLIDAINEHIISKLDFNFKIPQFLGGGSWSWKAPRIRRYESGGFVEEGQLFLARESGPELVGSIGGRTAVANNDQIVTAVSEGVAKAVSKVLGQGNSSGDVVLKVGELELGRISKLAINKYNKQTGNVTVEV